ncbi:MAG: hypothetical protein MI807_07570 [Verrucomicrobiales bacterium]|nr:hypothetical protein [Verrucomicrobiales bacterium]
MNSKAWDKIILVVVSLVVLGLSGLFVMKALGFSELFTMETANPKNDLPEVDINRVKGAGAILGGTFLWNTPEKGAPAVKPVPLFVSIPIVESGGQMIDMLDPNAPKLREPVTNSWLMANNLDYLNSNVLNQDPDGDGFSSIQEWEAKTGPTDADSHPPYASKIQMISRQQQEYKLKFASRPDSESFQVTRLPTARWPQRDNFYLKIGDVSEDKQFRVDSFEEKRARNNVGIDVDASVLTITYLPKEEQAQLIRNIDTVIPTYYAELAFPLDPSSLSGNDRYVKEGDAFNIVIDPETKYRVVKVNENSVVISYQKGDSPEQTIEINKN